MIRIYLIIRIISPVLTVFLLGFISISKIKAQCQGFMVDITSNPPPPFNLCPGETIQLTSTVTGGTPPYTYLWADGSTGPTTTITPPYTGAFPLDVSDALGCVASNSIHIKATVWTVDILYVGLSVCVGDSMEIFAFPDFPAGTTFLWSTGETSTSIFITTSGTYSLTATAPGGACSASVSEYIDMPFFPQPQPNISGPTVLCPGQNATLSAQGGSGDTYDWSTGAQTSSITISAPGIYSVTVTNTFGCTGTDSIEILPGSTSPIISAPTVLCNGQNGTIEIVNASSYIDFLWSTGETTSTITINAPGTYSVTVTAAGGCTGTGSVTIASGTSNITINGTTSPVTSCSPQNGAVNITVTPSGTYTYSWSNGETSEDINNLSPGSYSVTVTDIGGCTSSDAFTVTSNVVLPSTSTNVTPASCDLNNGAIDLSVTPAGTYTFSWSNGETTEDIFNIIAGTYTVTVTSTSNGCTATASVIVTNINPAINITGSTTPFSSCTMPNGAIDMTPSPAGTYTFTWSNGETTEDISNLSAGSYSVTVSAGGSCTSTATYTVTNNTAPPMPAAVITPATCGQSNGGLDISVTPAGSYSFLWSNGATSEDLSSISAGTYTVTVTDIGSGCSAAISSIVPDNPIAIAISGTTMPNTSCLSTNGGIDITAQPAGTYTYLWSNGATTEDLNTLPAGTYSVTLTLGVSCVQTATFQVLDNINPILLSGIVTPNTSCTQPNGAIDLSVDPPGTYTYIWSNGITTEDQSQLTGGTYTVTVTASNGCTATSMFDVVNTNSNYTFTEAITQNNSCVTPNGSIDLTLNPVGTYSFLWSNGSTTEDINLLPAGTYGVTVSDVNSCSSVATYTVADSIVSPSITAQLSPETCGNQNGAIDLSILPVSGNSFSWSNGFMTEDISGLSAGVYIVTVTGANGCTTVDSFTINIQNSNFTVTDSIIPNTRCLMPNGVIDLSVSPSGAYTFIWSNASTTEDISGLASGSYTVTVTDAANCSSIDTFLIQNNISAPLLSSVRIPANCGAANGAIDLMVSPAINISFLWSNGLMTEDLQNILPGIYSVIVTDTISGCEAVDTINVDNINNNFSASAIPVPNTSCVSPNGSIDLTVTPAGAFTFLWSNGAMTEDLSNLSSGSYTVTITDITTCSSIETIVITDNLPVVLITPVITPSTCGLNNGAIDLSINPNSGNTFQWSNGAITEDLVNLSPGDYSVTITGTGGCTAVDTFNVPAQGAVSTISGITSPNTNCFTFNGAIDISVLPAGTYTYQWSNGIHTQDQAALSPGLYTVTVSDAAGCTSSSSFTIDDQSILPSIQVIVVPATCGNSNGQIDITVSPAGSYAFDWSNSSANEDLFAVSPGMYSVTVTGANGCAADTSVEVMNTGLSFSVSGSTTHHTSCTTWNGAIEITINPGGNYTFLWSDGQSTEDLTAVEPGVYVVTVTDLAGCSTSAQYTVDNNVIPIMVDDVITPVLCGEPNGAIDLTITPSSGNTFIWSNGNTTEDLDNILTGHYEVTITTQNGCNTSSAFDVPGSEGVQITLQTNTTSAGSNLITITAQLNVSPSVIDTIIWLPEYLFDCNSALCLEQTITRPDTKTEIKVIAIDTNGCLAQASLLFEDQSNPKVYIPNVFSPNGDGINDVFTIYGNDDVDRIVELQIFDRWGNQVFINREFPPNEINFGWDGTFRNKDMNPAVFAYWARVRYKDGTEAPHKGDVTIVR